MSRPDYGHRLFQLREDQINPQRSLEEARVIARKLTTNVYDLIDGLFPEGELGTRNFPAKDRKRPQGLVFEAKKGWERREFDMFLREKDGAGNDIKTLVASFSSRRALSMLDLTEMGIPELNRNIRLIEAATAPKATA